MDITLKVGDIFYSKYLYNKLLTAPFIMFLNIKIVKVDSEKNELTVNYGSNDEVWNLEHCLYAFERSDYMFTNKVFLKMFGI